MTTLHKIILFRITTHMTVCSKDNEGNRDTQVRINITENKTKYF
jgi:hypothetical protein